MTSKVVFKTSTFFYAKRKTFREKIMKVILFRRYFYLKFYQIEIIKNLTLTNNQNLKQLRKKDID